MVVNCRIGPTWTAPNRPSRALRNSGDINRRKASSVIDAENAKLAARLDKVRGGKTKLPNSSKRRPRKKAGANGLDSGFTMEQEWRKYQQKTAMEDRADDWCDALAANADKKLDKHLLPEGSAEADELAAMEEECRLRLLAEQQKACSMMWTG